ncbi:hypothetical protein IE81DRAFT_199685 [Ceraceosorus guamensis]|uniref:Secreted protein n=1 Tax=Ceraceosorus guamensis TaxID=1522189 RepID=A0A316VTK1_9BASI|nr:hypothetical protein IE81DRAFT_199685 [Ceraceosorus guamensis]PWN40917.1 hypothetical protein IE81DRAFT_199685 [Ceraceosorus guamensis]
MTMHLSKCILLFIHLLLPKSPFTPRDVARLSIAHLAIRLGHLPPSTVASHNLSRFSGRPSFAFSNKTAIDVLAPDLHHVWHH